MTHAAPGHMCTYTHGLACVRRVLMAWPPCFHLLLLRCSEEDRRERRRKLGLPEELSEEEKAKEAARLAQLYEEQEKKKLNLAVKPISCEQAVLRPRQGLFDDASCGMTQHAATAPIAWLSCGITCCWCNAWCTAQVASGLCNL